jgi:hypothetical protein
MGILGVNRSSPKIFHVSYMGILGVNRSSPKIFHVSYMSKNERFLFNAK